MEKANQGERSVPTEYVEAEAPKRQNRPVNVRKVQKRKKVKPGSKKGSRRR